MTETEALARVRELCADALRHDGRHPTRGSWLTLLEINRVLAAAEPSVSITPEEAAHLAAIVPTAGSYGVVDQPERKWFAAHGGALTSKLTGARR